MLGGRLLTGIQEGRLKDAAFKHGKFADTIVMGLVRPEFRV
jgi:hypothetical protein